MTHDAVIEALLATLAATPDNLPVRTHVAQLLLNAAGAVEALTHATTVLGVEPDNSISSFGLDRFGCISSSADTFADNSGGVWSVLE